MNLSPQQCERFYRIWFALLHYVNKQRHIAPNFPEVAGQANIDPADAVRIRDVLWDNDALRESFIATNPVGLSPEDLALVASWRYRVVGKFFCLRHLKKYSIFLSEAKGQLPAHAYGVVGLISPIEDVMGPGSILPVYAEAVLLPFEGQITYDGLPTLYSVSFGPGFRAGLNEAYRNAQEREGIITTLEPSTTPTDLKKIHDAILARNKKIVNAFQKDLLARKLSYTMAEKHVGTIDTFARTCLLAQNPPRGLLETTLADVQAYLSTPTDSTTKTSFKRFVRFLDETGRMDYDQVAPLHDFLKHSGD
ncbi:MAG: hypothetical protein ABI406_19555 [Ktedonobacteraceae bacterium]